MFKNLQREVKRTKNAKFCFIQFLIDILSVTGSIPFSCFSEESNFPQNCVIFYQTEVSKIKGSNLFLHLFNTKSFSFFSLEFYFQKIMNCPEITELNRKNRKFIQSFIKTLTNLTSWCLFVYSIYFILFYFANFCSTWGKNGERKIRLMTL